MRALYAWFLGRLVDQDEAELRERTIDGSACDRWAAQTRMQINHRIDHIRRLRAPRMSPQTA